MLRWDAATVLWVETAPNEARSRHSGKTAKARKAMTRKTIHSSALSLGSSDKTIIVSPPNHEEF